MSVLAKLGAPVPFDAEAAFTTSPFLSPLALAVIRLTLAFYTLFTIIFVLAWESIRLHDANSFFSYFTELSYIGLCSYFFASGVQTLVYALSQGRNYPLERWPRILQFLHVLLFSTISTFPFIVTIVFWGALHPGNPFTDMFDVWSNVSMHALNSVFAAFEIFCTRAGPTPWLHIPALVILLAGYLGIAYITHATQGFYTYTFLDPVKEGAALAGWIIGIAAVAVVIFSITRTLCFLRERFTRGPSSRSRSHLQPDLTREELDEWETVEVERPAAATSVTMPKKANAPRKMAMKSSVESAEQDNDTSFETSNEEYGKPRRKANRDELV